MNYINISRTSTVFATFAIATTAAAATASVIDATAVVVAFTAFHHFIAVPVALSD